MNSNNSNRFHLAIEAGDLDMTVPWYTNVLGCSLDMKEEGRWQDVNFWGNELTLHASKPRPEKGNERSRHDVDMGKVCVPHFGIHLDKETYLVVKERVAATGGFLDEPYVRFAGTDYEQETFFVEDPNYNVLEIKSMSNAQV
tara:strand:- start:1187 stop:1612 length:426 start_codon:yes stop_codon:yes gene_type:complete